ncbi:hypothetical protein CQ12_35735 [Bradyrhizobium jicamae]|uniref:Uncharacterized protein n=1 Tax=Bradyrhizobium jicamae TaxID=280332 RepID=A0A0R3KIU3_9BRAD|nr:hypothetical protein CQ12_35735 [Bradyrhizobium jicamae]
MSGREAPRWLAARRLAAVRPAPGLLLAEGLLEAEMLAAVVLVAVMLVLVLPVIEPLLRPLERWMGRAARLLAGFPAAMMEMTRAAAPKGRQPACPRCHRTPAKPGQQQRCTPPPARRRGSETPASFPEKAQAAIAGQVGPKATVEPVRATVDARHRAPFLQAVRSNG